MPSSSCLPDERKFFAATFRGKVYVFVRTTQGSRGAPLTWARVAALITRLTMSVLGPEQNRMSTYVDDPLISSVGTQKERHRHFALALMVWGALRLPLSLKKAKIGKEITWISGHFVPMEGGVIVQLKQELLDDILQMIQAMLQSNLLKIKDVRSLDGKLTHVASLISTSKKSLPYRPLRHSIYKLI